MIGLIDYGAGNLFSVRNALDRLGRESRLIASPAEFEGVDRLVLPGVGHFGAASDRLRASGIFDALKNWADAGRPLLGICLGMQLLFEESEEDGGRSPGLGVFRGRIVELHGPRRLHMGWNTIIPTAAGVPPFLGQLVKDGKANEGGLAQEGPPKVNGESKARPLIPSGPVVPEGYYYFVHGFAPGDENAEDVLGETRFGETVFSAAVGRGSILGLQFHPEKSGKIGLDLMARWADGKMDGASSKTEGRLPPTTPAAMRRGKRGNKGRRLPPRGLIKENMDSRPAVRIIPCLDMDDGRVVKGVRFENLRDAGDPAELARDYNAQGADELCFLDVGASWKSRKTLLEVVRRVSREVFIPLTVGGGLCSIEDIREALSAGADKVSICTAAVDNPELLTATAERFGRQCLVLSLDAKAKDGGWTVTTHGGRRDRNLDVVAWAARAEALGAGEILLNSVDRDGTGAGYDLELLRRVRAAVRIPVIASGGGDQPAQIWEAIHQGEADAVLLASALHSGRRTVADYKYFLHEKGARLR